VVYAKDTKWPFQIANQTPKIFAVNINYGEKIMSTQKPTSYLLLTFLIGACCCLAQTQAKGKPKTQYQVSDLPSLGGTSSGGNSINDQSWVSGYSRMADRNRHATLWRNSVLTDLHTLGGPNSSVTWNVKNTAGIIVGISQTATTPEPNGENWSSAAFYSTPNNAGYINLGFVWQNNQMRGLPPFPGGNNGFATGANNLGQVVGWAENGVHDPTCCCADTPGHQVLQFRPAVWTLGPPDQIHDLPLIPGDTSGAATAINDNGQIVGISGICDQAVGRHTAKHAVLWENGGVTDIGNLGADGGTRRRQSINTAMSSGLPATPPLLKAIYYTLLSGQRTTVSKLSNRCGDVSRNM